MKVSIITVCFNSESTISDAIKSVLNQTYPDIEYIVIDGGSTDSTIDIVKSFESTITKFVSESDQGIYDAMNKGVSLATGDVICFLNSDDMYFDKNVIDLVVKNFESKSIRVLTSNVQFFNSANEKTRFYKSFGFKKEYFKFGFMPAHPGTFLVREIFDIIPSFSLDLKIAADFEFLLRVYSNIKKDDICELNETTVLMRDGGVSTNDYRSNWIITKEMYKVLRRNNKSASYLLLLCRFPIKLLHKFLYK